MRKRKITKKSLDELAKIMPVLTEQEARECVGAAKFYDISSGNSLGQIGGSTAVRFISINEFETLKSSYPTGGINGKPMTDSQVDANGKSLTQVSDNIKQSFVKSIISDLNISGFAFTSVTNGSGNEMSTKIDLKNKTIELFLCEDGGFAYENYASLKNTIYHEYLHTQYQGYTESYIILKQVKHSSYDNTSDEYKKQTAEYLLSVEPSLTKERAYELCKVDKKNV